MTLGDRIVVMKDGIIHQNDTPLKTYSYPVNASSPGFIGMPPMNFFDGAIKMVRRAADLRGREAEKRPRRGAGRRRDPPKRPLPARN
jgi:ABC-type sugar transport system ATPase subunit